MPKKGEWVEVEQIILKSEERPSSVPDDTRATPLIMRVRGFLQSDAEIGEAAEVLTKANRLLSGKLRAVNPAYDHSFGEPIPELLEIGPMLRAILEDGEA